MIHLGGALAPCVPPASAIPVPFLRQSRMCHTSPAHPEPTPAPATHNFRRRAHNHRRSAPTSRKGPPRVQQRLVGNRETLCSVGGKLGLFRSILPSTRGDFVKETRRTPLVLIFLESCHHFVGASSLLFSCLRSLFGFGCSPLHALYFSKRLGEGSCPKQ